MRTARTSGTFGSLWRNFGSPVSLAGVTGNPHPTCEIAFDDRAFGNRDLLVGALARAVTSAVRCLFGVAVVSDDQRERMLIDVTSVALGFGVLTVNDAHAVASVDELRPSEHLALFGGAPGAFGSNTGVDVGEGSAHVENGALSARARTFLLSAVVVVRGLDPAPVRSALRTNQAAWFVKMTERLKARGNLPVRLGLPASSGAATSRAIEPRSMTDDGIVVGEAFVVSYAAARSPVFRVKRAADAFMT